MVNKGIALAVLLAMASTSVHAHPEKDFESGSMIGHKLTVSQLDTLDKHATKVTVANQKLDEKSDGKGAKAPSRLAKIGNWFASVLTKFVSYFSF